MSCLKQCLAKRKHSINVTFYYYHIKFKDVKTDAQRGNLPTVHGWLMMPSLLRVTEKGPRPGLPALGLCHVQSILHTMEYTWPLVTLEMGI